MKITHFGHACILVESGGARVLLDPGTFSTGYTELTELDAVLVTHQHFDHLDTEALAPLLDRNPAVTFVVEAATAGQLPDAVSGRAHVVAPGDRFDVSGLDVQVVGGTHALIHADVPRIPNVGFYFHDFGLLHPGDELTPPNLEVELLALPISGPWQKLSDTVDYLRAVAPATAFPIHEAVTSRPGLFHAYLESLKPASTVFRVLEHGASTEL
ncbi:MBL fold metallo-hydrolase [Nocardioides humi]|uniref:MBL fold metallo-hydrolase n=1 Tax=Nocardioides humi TaxID=449461 RepID=A0ABN2ACH0_9ACTN|nr:MBL fold metallo-hydrolase [Nocardioides humi]